MNAAIESVKPVTRFGAVPESSITNNGDSRLQSEIKITLHTKLAVKIWAGRKKTDDKPAIVSYPRFADVTRLIEQSVRNDDPYADYYFYKLHDDIKNAREKIQTMRQGVEQLIAENLPEGISMTRSLSQNPEIIELRIASKLAFTATYMLSDFDILVRQVMLARHAALLDRETSERFLYQAQRVIRSVLHSTSKWRFTSVTRDDMAANNQAAQRAIEAMGELEPEFLTGEKRSPLAPPIIKQSNIENIMPEPKDTEESLEAALDALESEEMSELGV